MRSKKEISALILATAVAFGSAALYGCGDGASQSSATPTASNILQSQVPAGNYNGQQIASAKGLPVAALTGLYETTITKGGTSQRAVVVVREVTATDTGNTYLSLDLSSSGPLGTIVISKYAVGQPTVAGSSDGVVRYDVMTQAADADALSTGRVALIAVIALRENNQFDPTQSMIRFMDCGFSQYACLNPLNDVQSGLLTKR